MTTYPPPEWLCRCPKKTAVFSYLFEVFMPLNADAIREADCPKCGALAGESCITSGMKHCPAHRERTIELLKSRHREKNKQARTRVIK